MKTRSVRVWLALLTSAVCAASIALVTWPVSGAAAAPTDPQSALQTLSALPSGGMAASEVAGMFRGYGDEGGHWTGGDSTVSVALPDGRVAWLFSDTFLGTVNTDGSRPGDSPMVNNTIVVQDGTNLVATLHGGTAMFPSALVQPDQPGEFFWVADGLVEGDALKVLYNRYRRYGGGSLDVELTGTSLATFALPGLTLSSVVDLPAGRSIHWGAALLVDGGYTYVYGTSSGLANMKFAHLARVSAGDLGGAWQYWTGSAWSADPAAAGRMLSGVGTAYAVQRLGGQYVLFTQDNNAIFDPQFVAYTAVSPTGPFTGPVHLFTAPEAVPGGSTIAYSARLHPDLARPGKLLMSYDVNTFDSDATYADARLYRPRFVELDWPLPQPDPSALPTAPGGLTVTADDAGVAHLQWAAVAGATGYYVHRRDVTGGQTHFLRLPQPVTAVSADVGGLTTGHRYEFRVTAANAVGAGPSSATVTATLRVVRDASVIRLANQPDSVPGAYRVVFKDNPAVRVSGVEAFARELLTQSGGTLDRVFANVLNGFSASLTQAQAIDLAGHPDVESVEQDYYIDLAEPSVGDFGVDAAGVQTGAPWGLDRVDQRGPQPDTTYHYPGEGVGVHAYVLDTGVRSAQKDFGGRLGAGVNTTVNPRNTDTEDCHGHGTHVAGILGGNQWGAAKKVTIHPVRVFYCVTDQTTGVIRAISTATSVVDGVEWVSRNVQRPAVVNMSLTFYAPGRPALGSKTDVDIAVGDLAGDGVTVVVAAGNRRAGQLEADDACNIAPAHADRELETDRIITVGNVNKLDSRDATSNYGPCIDIWAPGTDIPSADFRTDEVFPPVLKTGTSMASPLVAGVVALILEAHPDYTNTDVQEVLFNAATTANLADLRGAPDRLLFVEPPPTHAPTNLVATAGTDGTIGLTWTAVPEPGVHYLVSSRDITAGETSFTRLTERHTATSAIVRGLRQDHTYEFTVAAANSVGIGPESNAAGAVAHTPPPPAPVNLTATTTANGTIKLSWTSAVTNVWFNVYQRDITAGQTEFTQLPLPIVACCEMTAGYLTHNHEYEYKVIATGQIGDSAPSNLARARSMYPTPAAPTNLTITAGDGQAVLTWTASTTANVWYAVYFRDVTSGDTEFTAWELPVTECCTATAIFLANGHEYEFKVTTTAAGGESGPSNLVRVVPQPPVPGQVNGLTATANTDGSITLSWTAPGGGSFWYDVYQRDATAGGSFTKLPLPVTTCCTFKAAYLTHNHVYEYKVAATNGRVGPLSAAASATSRYSRPAAPANLRGIAAGDGTIDLNWDAPGGCGCLYWVYWRDVTAGQTSFIKGAYPVNDTSVTMGPLVHGHVYEFKVSADNQGGEGPASATIKVTSLGGLPARPTGLTAEAGDGRVILRWTASPTAGVGYTVYQRDTTTNQSWQKLPLPVSGTSMTANYLTNGHTYEFKVTASNASGPSAASNVASARPLPPLPQPPSGLTAAAGNGKVTLRWTASPTPYVLYRVDYRDKTVNQSWRRLPVPVNGTSLDVNYLANGHIYEFKVLAENLRGLSNPTSTVSAKPMPPIPDSPYGLTATPGDSMVTLRWTASPTPNVWYWIELRPSGGEWQRLAYPYTKCCRFDVNYLSNGSLYEFRVVATNLAGDSAPSNTVWMTPRVPFTWVVQLTTVTDYMQIFPLGLIDRGCTIVAWIGIDSHHHVSGNGSIRCRDGRFHVGVRHQLTVDNPLNIVTSQASYCNSLGLRCTYASASAKSIYGTRGSEYCSISHGTSMKFPSGKNYYDGSVRACVTKPN